MSTTDAYVTDTVARIDEFEYRPISIAAVASVVFGLLSTIIFVVARSSPESALAFAPLPLLGLALGLASMRRIRSNEDQLSGAGAAIGGIVLSSVGLLGGLSFAGYIYATEAPEGYRRTSFADLRPGDDDLRVGRMMPSGIAALDGQKIFIKGYIRPDSIKYRNNIDSFLLVRDNNQCCFGDLSTVQYFDQMAVAMTDNLTVDYSQGVFRMGGTLHIEPQNAVNGSGLPVFILEADHAG